MFLVNMLLVGKPVLPADTRLSGQVDLWNLLALAGKLAGQDAKKKAHEHGLGVVFAREDGTVVEELPDGTIKVLHSASLTVDEDA